MTARLFYDSKPAYTASSPLAVSGNATALTRRTILLSTCSGTSGSGITKPVPVPGSGLDTNSCNSKSKQAIRTAIRHQGSSRASCGKSHRFFRFQVKQA